MHRQEIAGTPCNDSSLHNDLRPPYLTHSDSLPLGASSQQAHSMTDRAPLRPSGSGAPEYLRPLSPYAGTEGHFGTRGHQ
jgi:hypothetical protein